MSVSLQPAGRIGINEDWKWALDGVVLEERKMLELRIGSHWILGVLVKCSDGHLYWSSWEEGVPVPVTYHIQARWPETN